MTERESSLRERAQARIAPGGGAEPDAPLAVAELRRAVHELHVREIELELQNEELEQAQRRLEESRVALAASEHRYRESFERAPIGYLRLDQGGAILEANETAAELLAVKKNLLRGRKLTDFIESQHQDDCDFHRRAALDDTPAAPVRVALRALDGNRRVVELDARSIARDPGEVRIAILDVTALEHAETARDESERQRLLLADVLPLAVAYISADGRCQFCNEAFRKRFGSRANAVEGRALFEVLEPSHDAALRDHVRVALGGTSTRFEGELSFPEMGSRFVSLLLAPDPASDGRVRGFYALVDDRTDLETAQRGLREAAAQSSLAEERERRVLAADLHDDVGQLIALASIKLREHEKKITDPAAIESIREIADLVRVGPASHLHVELRAESAAALRRGIRRGGPVARREPAAVLWPRNDDRRGGRDALAR